MVDAETNRGASEHREAGDEGEMPRVALVGPGRTRNGLGPFVARHLADAGLRVVAGIGRDAARTEQACRELGDSLGWPVRPATDLDAVLADGAIDVVAIHSPAVAHAEALACVAGYPGVDVICDKPLVGEVAQTEDGLALVEALHRDGRVVVETCQWPESLSCFRELYPEVLDAPVAKLELGLSPGPTGPGMVVESLSHLLSLVQVLGLEPEPRLRELQLPEIAPDTDACAIDFEFETANGLLAARLALRVTAVQPRPAWLSVNGHRMDRHIDVSRGEYDIGFVAEKGGMRVTAGDPLRSLLYRAGLLIKERDVDAIRLEAQRIRGRAKLFAAVLDAIFRACPGA